MSREKMVSNTRIERKVNLSFNVKSTFRAYLEFLKPVHKLRNQEIQVLSLLLYYNHFYLEDFKHDEDRWRKVFSTEIKSKIREELNISSSVLQNIIYSLRKNKAISKTKGYNQVHPNFMMGLKKNTEEFILSLSFKIK